MATNIRYILKNDIASNWEDKNTRLLKGEPGYDLTNNRLKFGNGNTSWNDLPYLAPDVIDNLASDDTTAPLSAAQGKRLKEMIDNGGTEIINNLNSTATNAALSAAQGKVLRDLINSSGVDIVNNLSSTVATAALSAAQGKVLNDNKLAKNDIKEEVWTFTLDDDSTVTKRVALWNS